MCYYIIVYYSIGYYVLLCRGAARLGVGAAASPRTAAARLLAMPEVSLERLDES